MEDGMRAREVLGEILSRMGFEATVDVDENERQIKLDIKGEAAALVIGKKGQTLESLQLIVAKIVHRGREIEPGVKPIVLDAEGYRTRREESLVEMANRLAVKARQTGRPITVNPMSAHDRRIVHIAVDKIPGVTTRSEGEGIYRRLLILPAPDKT